MSKRSAQRNRVNRKPEVRIDRVTFRSSVQIRDFQHAHVEASATVPPGVTPEDALDKVKRFVAKELLIAKEGRVRQPVQPEGSFRGIIERFKERRRV